MAGGGALRRKLSALGEQLGLVVVDQHVQEHHHEEDTTSGEEPPQNTQPQSESVKIMPPPQLRFLSRVPPDRMPELLRTGGDVRHQGGSSDRRVTVLVHPTVLNETFGLVLVEAMAAEVPVVTFGVGGIRDFLQPGDTHGIVVSEPTPQGLADAMLAAIASPEALEATIEMGRRGRQEVFWRRLSANDMVDRYARLFHQVAGRRTRE